MPNYKWKQILNLYSNQQELIDLLLSTPYTVLAEKFDCSVDAIYTLRKKLGIGKKRTDVDEFLQKYSKEQLEDLYLNKYDRHLKDMADGLSIYQDTLSKIFEKLGIQQNPHHMSEYEEVRKIVGEKNRIHAIEQNYIGHILTSSDWHEKAVIARQSSNSYKQPHPENRKILGFSDEELEKLVLFHGVQKLAKVLNCSPSTIYTSCRTRKIKLSTGPTKEQISDPNFIAKRRSISVNTFKTKPKFANTSIEIALQEELKNRNILFETQNPLINLTVPDIFIQPNIAIYADGCWWHCCDICNLKIKNFEARGRDQYVNTGLQKAGYKVFRFWEHDIKKDVKACVDKIEEYIKRGDKNV